MRGSSQATRQTGKRTDLMSNRLEETREGPHAYEDPDSLGKIIEMSQGQ